MRYLLCLAILAGCSHADSDRTTLSVPALVRTQVTFEPLDREQAQRYLESERHSYKVHTDPMFERKAALEAGREERYHEIKGEFPECDRQVHCMAHISKGDIKRFERYNAIAKEIHAYDKELIEIDTAIRDWKNRLELRSRAILNRFLVHEVLQIPTIERRFQAILPHSLEHFESRRQVSMNLLRHGSQDLEPQLLGDYNFRMYGRPIDEAAVIATFDVYLMPPLNEMDQPTRYVVSMLVNTHQLDLRYYDRSFLVPWAAKMSEAFQKTLKNEAFCGVYSVAGETLAPRINLFGQANQCTRLRTEMQSLDAAKFSDRFPPDRWLLAIAYYPMNRAMYK